MKSAICMPLANMRAVCLAATALVGSGYAVHANATLIGDTVTIDYVSGSGDHIYNAVVGPATDPFHVVNNNLAVNITDGLIQFTDAYYSPHAAIYSYLPVLLTLTVSGMDFSDGSQVIGATAAGGTLKPQNVSFSANSVSFQFLDSLCTNSNCMSGGDFAAVTFTTGNVPAVPEPETYAMLLAGIGLIGTISRRRQLKILTS